MTRGIPLRVWRSNTSSDQHSRRSLPSQTTRSRRRPSSSPRVRGSWLGYVSRSSSTLTRRVPCSTMSSGRPGRQATRRLLLPFGYPPSSRSSAKTRRLPTGHSDQGLFSQSDLVTSQYNPPPLTCTRIRDINAIMRLSADPKSLVGVWINTIIGYFFAANLITLYVLAMNMFNPGTARHLQGSAHLLLRPGPTTSATDSVAFSTVLLEVVPIIWKIKVVRRSRATTALTQKAAIAPSDTKDSVSLRAVPTSPR